LLIVGKELLSAQYFPKSEAGLHC